MVRIWFMVRCELNVLNSKVRLIRTSKVVHKKNIYRKSVRARCGNDANLQCNDDMLVLQM